MRDFAKVAPSFWTGDTGRALRKLGPEAQLVALYLVTGPQANMIGLYYLPLPTLCHETGLSPEGASKALRRVFEGGFAAYDEHSEVVYVPAMANYQIGERISPKDNRHKAILRELEKYRKSRFYLDFYEKYRTAYHLPEPEPLPSPFEGASEPLRSQEQEQEQEKRPPSEVCTEPLTAASEPVILTAPTTGKGAKEWRLTAAKLAEYETTFSTLDVLAALRAAVQWCRDNPTKRKTAKGMPAFCTRWLNNCVDRGQHLKLSPPAANPPNAPSVPGIPPKLRELQPKNTYQ